MARLIRRPRRSMKKKAQYRMIGIYEVIKEGDEFWSRLKNEWRKCANSVGCIPLNFFSEETSKKVRRRIN